MTVHELKTWPGQFRDVAAGRKTFEVRRDDRGFAVGDRLVLREWDLPEERYTGRQLTVRVSHLLRGGEFGRASCRERV